MKAAVCYEFGKPLVIEDVTLDPPQHGEVRVRLGATAVCHSDIHVVRGELGGKPPLVPGHESAGWVDAVGEGVTLVKPGDQVVLTMVPSCGRCMMCVAGHPHLCEAKWPLSTESRLHNKKGQALAHMTRTASFAEYAVVDQSQLAVVPKDLPIDRAALLACGVITGFGAVVNRAQVRPMQSVVVIGCGGVGLNSVQGASVAGANPIIAVDVADNKLAAAKTFGATHGVRADASDAVEQVKQLTHGRGADYVFVTVGSTSAAQQGFLMTGPRGMLVEVGLPPRGATITVPGFMMGERMVTSSNMGSTKIAVEIPRLVELYRSGRLKLDELITARYPLERINEAMDAVVRGEALRNVIMF